MPGEQGKHVNGSRAAAVALGDGNDREQVYNQIVLAQNELREARGRVLEARSEYQVHEIVTFLRRVGVYLERADHACTCWTKSYAKTASAALADMSAGDGASGNGERGLVLRSKRTTIRSTE